MKSSPTASFITLGCAKNEVDTDKMQARLKAHGFKIEADASMADVVIVNTCAFLTSAVDESLEVVFDLAAGRLSGNKNQKILIAGCMPMRYGKDLERELTEADGFVSIADEERIAEIANAAIGRKPPACSTQLEAAHAGIRNNEGASAYVKISDGCSRFCSYCMIPHIRGPYHSFKLDAIDAEVRELVESGTKEIVLIGQDTGLWGADLSPKTNTAYLLDMLASRYPSTWFRLLYVQPAGITDELLDCIAGHENICSYLDMPLQHCNSDVLKAMNRKGSRQEYLDLIEHIRSRLPEMTCRTTLMAGFPGETEEQFEELCDFVEQAAFDYSVVFPFSPEQGSAAAEFDGQIDADERMNRAQRLLDICEHVGVQSSARHIGDVVDVLVEGYEYTETGVEAIGRTQGQAPDVDGQVHVPISTESELPVGSFVKVKITDSFFFELEGELVCS